MQLDISVRTEECQLRVVRAQGLELNDLRVDAPLAFHGELGSLVDFYHWWVEA